MFSEMILKCSRLQSNPVNQLGFDYNDGIYGMVTKTVFQLTQQSIIYRLS